MAEQLDRAHRAHRFQKIGFFGRARQNLFFKPLLPLRKQRERYREIQPRRHQHQRRQRHTDQRHHHKGRDGQQRIDHHIDQTLRDQILHRPHRAQPRQEIAHLSSFKIGQRQADQVMDDIVGELKRDALAQRQHHPTAQPADQRIEAIKRPKAQRQHGHQIGVALCHRLIDGQLHEIGHGQRRDLQHQRQPQDLRRGAAIIAHAAPQISQPHLDLGHLGRMAGRRLAFKRNAGEMARKLIHPHPPSAHRRVEDGHLVARNRLQHDEMVKIPMEDGRQAQLVDFVQFQPQGARPQPHIIGHRHQFSQRGALDRGKVLLTQPRQIDLMAMEVGNHRDAGQPAFGDLGLQHRRDLARPWEDERAHAPPLMSASPAATGQRTLPTRRGVASPDWRPASCRGADTAPDCQKSD